MSSIMKYDENGFKHGEWCYYWDNGVLSHRHTYVHGIRHGLEERYYSDGTLMYRFYYNIGKKVGYSYWDGVFKKYYLCLI